MSIENKGAQSEECIVMKVTNKVTNKVNSVINRKDLFEDADTSVLRNKQRAEEVAVLPLRTFKLLT